MGNGVSSLLAPLSFRWHGPTLYDSEYHHCDCEQREHACLVGQDVQRAWDEARTGTPEERRTFRRNVRVMEIAVAHAQALGVPEPDSPAATPAGSEQPEPSEAE